MNILSSGGFASFVNSIFENWQMIIFVLLATLLLLAIAFRKFKIVFIMLLTGAAAIGVVLLVDLVVEAISWELIDLINFLVKWVPTVLFTLIVLLATLTGVRRGLRKSLILLAHEVAASVVCIILYALLVNLPAVDKFMLNFVQLFTGGSGSLANKLGVSAELTGLKDVFVHWLPTVIKGDVGLILGGSTAYFYTLADLIYHVAFGLLILFVYLLLLFILYCFYLRFYSERKYKRKVAQRYADNKVDRRYSRHWIGGGVVGVFRGIAIGLLSLSFLGGALYMVAGRGDGTLKDYDFGNSDVNNYFSVYRSIESYGTYGIFKVLNTMSSADDMPYYLFAADLVFSGELDDEEFGVKKNVAFIEELGAYTGFARDTMSLLLKYGGDKIRPLLNGGATQNAFNTVVEVMSDELFRAEFDQLIAEFDEQGYVINFALSFVNSAIANLDNVSFASSVSAANKDMLKLLFTKGHLSDAIPDERELKLKRDASATELPYINISKLVDKKDVRIALNVVLEALSGSTQTADDIVSLAGNVLPEIKNISLLSENRAEELNPVLGRLYCFAANQYLSAEGSEGVRYDAIYADNVDWVGEMRGLVEASGSALELYSNVYSAQSTPAQMLTALFDKDGADYAQNMRCFDDVCDCLVKSRLLGKALSTSFVYNIIKSALSSPFKDIYIPADTVYESVFDGDGKLISAGELYFVFNGVRALAKSGDLLSTLAGFNSSTDMVGLLEDLSEAITAKDSLGNTLSYYVTNSDLLRSVLSATFITYGESYNLYVPLVAREKNSLGISVNLVTKEELSVLLQYLTDLTAFIKPIIQNTGEDMSQYIADFMENSAFTALIENSAIFEGTMGRIIVSTLSGSNSVVLPFDLTYDYDLWVTDGATKGELRRMLDALDAVAIEISEVLDGSMNGDQIKDKILTLSDQTLDTCLKSRVLHYTITKYLTGDGLDYGSFKLIVPNAALQTLRGDVIPALVKKDELKTIVKTVSDFDLSDDTDVSSVLVQLVKNKGALEKSTIISASVVYSLANSEDIGDALNLPDKYVNAAQSGVLKKFNSSNPWKQEVLRLIDALDEILGISEAEDFKFEESKLKENLSAMMRDVNAASTVNQNVTKLRVCYASEIVCNNITIRLDEQLAGKIESDMLYGAKSEGYYTYDELEALSNALKIFDIDIMDIDGDDLTRNVKDRLLTLNEEAEGFGGRSKLDVIYPSVIFSGMFSKELDNALLDKDDPMIESAVLYNIKKGSARYEKEELKNLINSIREFGIEKFEDIDTLDFDDIKDRQDRIDYICLSIIMKGVLTKQISKNNQLNVDHELAYDEYRTLRNDEIKSLVKLVDDVGEDNVENMYFEQVRLYDVKESIFFEDGTVKSYLILTSVSNSLKDNKDLIIDRNLIDTYGCVRADEVLALLNTFLAMEGDDVTLNSWNEKGGTFKYPDAEQRRLAFTSEIACAKITEQIINANTQASGNFIGTAKLTQFRDVKLNYRYFIDKSEMSALLDVIDVFNADGQEGSYAIPTFTVEKLAELNAKDPANVAKLFASDVIRYKVCDLIVVIYAQAYEKQEENAYAISDLKESTLSDLAVSVKTVISLADAEAIINALPQPANP